MIEKELEEPMKRLLLGWGFDPNASEELNELVIAKARIVELQTELTITNKVLNRVIDQLLEGR